MLKKVLKISIGLFIIGNASFAQWGGSTTITGDIYRSGNVGIGTGTYVPLKLTVFVNQQNDGIGLTGTASKDISLMYNMTSGAWNPLTQSGDHMLMWKATGIDDVNAGGLVIGPWSNGFKGMRITSAGNVGIGTGETSFHRLNVNGSTGTKEIWVANSPTKDISLQNNLTQGAWNGLTQPGDNLLMWKSSNPDQADAGGLVIAPWSNANNGIRINSDGNVSIGTSNPGSFKLAVEGRIAARGVKVTLQSFPDYVFDSTYQLRPLASLSKFIDQNKHLPGIPSATEVKKEGGVELGDMNVKLLEKVEELTLYILELNKKLEAQEKKIERLEKSALNK
jgi:hypothetical protein